MKSMTLKTRMLLISLVALALLFVSISILYLRTSSSLHVKAVETLDYTAREITANVEEIIISTQNVSDAFANEPRLLDFLDRNYKPTDSGEPRIVEKRAAMTLIRNQIFGGVNRIRTIDQIAAIYNSVTDELFNLYDFNAMGPETVAQLLDMDITNSKRFSRFYWYPLQDNFLKSYRYGDLRQDLVVIGSRRIFSHERLIYPYVHIFIIQEYRLYECYQNLAEQNRGEVYLLDQQGGLLSTSNEEALAARNIAPALRDAILAREQDSFELRHQGVSYFVSVNESALRMGDSDRGWLTVLMVPRAHINADINQIYLAFFIALLFCFLVCSALLLYLYRQFMGPISDLGAAMKRVDHGDMNAYVKTRTQAGEAGQMIRRYNRMLQSINRNVEEKIAHEKTRKDLEMQVLTTQINPHFLYNTLETIVWKANEAARPDIGKIASALGKMYRLSISGGEVWVPLRQEIEHVKSYMDIQLSRYEGQFTFACSVPPEAESWLLPKLVLQPVVENVFLYAMPETEKPVAIHLRAQIVDAGLEITISDDGKGMDEAALAAVRAQIQTGKAPDTPAGENGSRRRSTGIGLHNIRARLELYMGVDEPLRIESEQGRGTTVTLLVSHVEEGNPAQTKPPKG